MGVETADKEADKEADKGMVVSSSESSASGSLDVARIRDEFPILKQQVHGKPLVYLDNAASAQKPQCVIDAVRHFYERDNANIHRGVHALSVRATNAHERARARLRRFLGAERTEELVFVRSATEAINLVAQSYGRSRLRSGDEILITELEHHSNIVPWQMLCEQVGATLRVAPINDAGEVLFDAFKHLLSDKTKIAAFAHVSNALGTINPVVEMTLAAHDAGAVVVIDGAQAAPHMSIDVRAIGCDFYAITGHKMFGPTGIGVLYGRYDLLNEMPPYQGGGDMILSVSFEKTVYNHVPHKFEAGTPNIAGAIGMGSAAEYLMGVGVDRVARYEHELLAYATETLSAIPHIRLIGTSAHKASVLSFLVENVHAHDVGTILDNAGVAVRTGHHCAQPVMKHFGVDSTARASIALYNTKDDIDALAAALNDVVEVFG
jgi:cysteine desulfurase/selenocysteine lyase